MDPLTQPTPNRDACLFCSALLVGGRSKEHVLPQWLLDELKIRDTEITPTHFAPDGSARSTRRHKLEKLQEGRVCSQCNTGWMSRMEDGCKKILSPLLGGHGVVADLRAEERFLLARWAAKTAYVLNSASNFDQHVPREHYAILNENPGVLAPGVVVVAQQHSGTERFSWWQGAVWQIEGHDLKTIELLRRQTYKISLLLGHLLVTVAWWPHPGWLFTLWRGVHVPLWPRRGPVAYFDSADPPFPWNDSTEALAAFHATLGLKQYP